MDNFQRAEAIALRLGLSISRIQEILNFLTSRGLCFEDRGKFKRTEKNTHVEASSPLALRHHQNWRVKALELQERMTSDDVAFTAPISLAKKDIPKVRSIILSAISGIAKTVEDSPSEEVAYLGIDWLRL